MWQREGKFKSNWSDLNFSNFLFFSKKICVLIFFYKTLQIITLLLQKKIFTNRWSDSNFFFLILQKKNLKQFLVMIFKNYYIKIPNFCKIQKKLWIGPTGPKFVKIVFNSVTICIFLWKKIKFWIGPINPQIILLLNFFLYFF